MAFLKNCHKMPTASLATTATNTLLVGRKTRQRLIYQQHITQK